MTNSPPIEQARRSFAAGSWSDACAAFAAADGGKPLEPEDLERLATRIPRSVPHGELEQLSSPGPPAR